MRLFVDFEAALRVRFLFDQVRQKITHIIMKVKSIKTVAALVLGVGVWLRSHARHGDIRVGWGAHEFARE
jgi:hypothetical protein